MPSSTARLLIEFDELTLSGLARLLRCEIIVSANKLDERLTHCCAADLMSDVLAFSKPGTVLLSGLTSPQVIRTADVAEAKAVVIVRGKRPEENTVNLAEKMAIPLLSTEISMFEACGLLFDKKMRP